MKRTLLIGTLLTLSLVGGAAAKELRGEIAEAREITLWCGGYALSISPVTSVAYITYSWTGTVFVAAHGGGAIRFR
jgi:hypothetical protein